MQSTLFLSLSQDAYSVVSPPCDYATQIFPPHSPPIPLAVKEDMCHDIGIIKHVPRLWENMRRWNSSVVVIGLRGMGLNSIPHGKQIEDWFVVKKYGYPWLLCQKFRGRSPWLESSSLVMAQSDIAFMVSVLISSRKFHVVITVIEVLVPCYYFFLPTFPLPRHSITSEIDPGIGLAVAGCCLTNSDAELNSVDIGETYTLRGSSKRGDLLGRGDF